MVEATKKDKEGPEKSGVNVSGEEKKATVEQREMPETRQEVKEDQPKRTDFPLDHVLPVFNIARADQANSQK